jgi:hypothetical protein
MWFVCNGGHVVKFAVLTITTVGSANGQDMVPGSLQSAASEPVVVVLMVPLLA